MSLFDHKLSELHALLEKKEMNVSDLVDHSFKRIAEVDDKVKAFITLDEEKARASAAKLDEALNVGAERGLLFGMPIGIKDSIVTKDLRTTAASRMLENFMPIYDATVMEKLRDAEAITIGKLNMDEFSMGSTGENSAIQETKNPWNLDYVPGGGAAAAVAAGEVPFSLASETGGSIRQSASFCGVVGLKPTYGRVSRYGLVAHASSLDHIGPITRNVEDSAYLLQAIAGLDPKDSSSYNTEVPNYLSALTGDVKGLKIAVPKEFLGEDVQAEVKESVLASLKVLEGLGATWEEVSLPHAKYALATYHLLSSSEATTSLARYDGIRYGYRAENVQDLTDLYERSRGEGFGEEVKLRLILGTYALGAGNYDVYYRKAQKVRALIREDFVNVLEKYDVIIGPTTPTQTTKIGEKTTDRLSVNENDALTTPANLAGVPAISVPCGSASGLPLGLQIIGNYFDESTVYRVAHAFEQATDYHKQKPTL